MQRVLVDLSVLARSIIDDGGSDQGRRAGSDDNLRGIQKRDRLLRLFDDFILCKNDAKQKE